MKGFCEKCRERVEFYVKMVDKKKDIRGNLIKYAGKAAYCAECNSEIFVPEIRDYNLRELDNAYREAENLINIEDIVKILEV